MMQSSDSVCRHIVLSPTATASYSACVLLTNQPVAAALAATARAEGRDAAAATSRETSAPLISVWVRIMATRYGRFRPRTIATFGPSAGRRGRFCASDVQVNHRAGCNGERPQYVPAGSGEQEHIEDQGEKRCAPSPRAGLEQAEGSCRSEDVDDDEGAGGHQHERLYADVSHDRRDEHDQRETGQREEAAPRYASDLTPVSEPRRQSPVSAQSRTELGRSGVVGVHRPCGQEQRRDGGQDLDLITEAEGQKQRKGGRGPRGMGSQDQDGCGSDGEVEDPDDDDGRGRGPGHVARRLAKLCREIRDRLPAGEAPYEQPCG